MVQQVDAIALTGGSAYGLVTASGVMRWLEQHDQGFRVGAEPSQVVPIVPAAVIYDLGRGGRFSARPPAEYGYRAIAEADDGDVEQGNVGAGTGAVSGGLKGGVGTASVVLENGVVVGALVIVNSAGSTVDPDTCFFYAAHLELGNEFGPLRRPSSDRCEGDTTARRPDARQKLNTTIAVVATNAPLDKEEAQKMAGVAHDGIARAIRPVHTLFDGDSVFALSTGAGAQAGASGTAGTLSASVLNSIYTAGADALARAVIHAMLSAESVAGYESYCDTYPRACPEQRGASSTPGSLASGNDSTGRDVASETGTVLATSVSPREGSLGLAGAGVAVVGGVVVALWGWRRLRKS